MSVEGLDRSDKGRYSLPAMWSIDPGLARGGRKFRIDTWPLTYAPAIIPLDLQLRFAGIAIASMYGGETGENEDNIQSKGLNSLRKSAKCICARAKSLRNQSNVMSSHWLKRLTTEAAGVVLTELQDMGIRAFCWCEQLRRFMPLDWGERQDHTGRTQCLPDV